MTMIEKQVAKAEAEVQKALKGIERHEKWNVKKEANCIKLCGKIWTDEEQRSFQIEIQDKCKAEAISQAELDKANKMWGAWFDWHCNQRDIEEYKQNLARAERNLAKLLGVQEVKEEEQKLEDHINSKEVSWIRSIKTAEETQAEYEAWLRRFKAECLEDGIKIDEASNNYISGLDSQDRKFTLYINNGWCERSIHSYTLRIDGQTIFTSGLFSTGYRYLMKH